MSSRELLVLVALRMGVCARVTRVLRGSVLGGSRNKFQNTYFRRYGGCLAAATMSAYPIWSREERMPEAADDNKAHDRTDEIRSTRSPKLREDQIEVLKRYGQTRKTEVGEVLFRAGDTSNDFIVVLEGEVEVVDDFAGEARTIGVFRAGRFPGELNMLTGQAMYLTAVVRQGGEVLAIPRERLKEIVTEEPALSDIILKAFLARRSYLMRAGVGLRIIGSRHSRDATRLREIAARNRLPHSWIELEEAVRDAGYRLAGRGRTEEPDERRVCPSHRPQGRRSPGANLRPRRGGSRTRGLGRGGLRGIGGPLYPRPRVCRPGRASGHLNADRELPGFPSRSLGLRARQPRPGPG
jgi:CRP-like cAMP-binding protein